MSDRPDPPVDAAVELASRHLDGDLSVDERALAEADPDVIGWVARFDGARRALREPVDVDATLRESALAAALTAFDEEISGDPAAPAPQPPVVTDLATVRARRAGRLGKWLGAAAAAAAVAVGGVALTGNLGGNSASNDDSVAFSTKEEPSDGGAADRSSATDNDATMTMDAPSATAAGGGEGAAPTTAATSAAMTTGGPAATEAPGTGSVADQVDAAELQSYATNDPVTLPDGAAAPCADEVPGELVATDVTYADSPAVIYRDDAAHVITAYAADDCALLDSVAY